MIDASSVVENMLAVPFPSRADDARDVILVLANQFVGPLVSRVMLGSTPVGRRSALPNRQLVPSQVRAGAMLLDRVAPELVGAYARFYLQQAGVRDDASWQTFERVFAIPMATRDELLRQVTLATGTN